MLSCFENVLDLLLRLIAARIYHRRIPFGRPLCNVIYLNSHLELLFFFFCISLPGRLNAFPIPLAYYYLEHRLALLNPRAPSLLLCSNVTDCRPYPRLAALRGFFLFSFFFAHFFSTPKNSRSQLAPGRFIAYLSSHHSSRVRREEN
jgi:hypothetical protein